MRLLVDGCALSGTYASWRVLAFSPRVIQRFGNAISMKIQWLLLCLLVFVMSGRAAEFDLGARGTLSLSVPEDWKVENREVKDREEGKPVGYAITFTPQDGAKAKGLINLIYTTNGIPA